MKTIFIYFLLLTFFSFSVIAASVFAGGGGGCGDDTGCNNVMYGIAIAGTLFIIYLILHERSDMEDQIQIDVPEEKEKISIQIEQPTYGNVIQELAVFRW